MFCPKCGKEIPDEAVVCTNCGCATNGANDIYRATAGEDVPSVGFNVLGFFVPIAGLVLFCTMINKTPTKAKQIGMWALIGYIIKFVILTVSSKFMY